MDARRRSNAGINTDMVCSILRFLDASPDILLDALSNATSATSIFNPFLFCVLSPETSVRQLATNVAERLFKGRGDGFRSVPKSNELASREFRKELWSRRYDDGFYQSQWLPVTHSC
jgi:neurofibromin 1